MQEPTKSVIPFHITVNELPAKEWLEELFEYRPEEGLFWKLRPESHFQHQVDWYIWNKRFAGKRAGSKIERLKRGTKRRDHSRVQLAFCAGGRLMTFAVHRIAHAMMGKEIPLGMVVDHKNGDVWDNSWDNLRIANHTENHNNSGGWRVRKYDLPKGVYFDPKNPKPYYGMLKDGKKYRRLPNRLTVEEARRDYCEAATSLHGEFVNLGRATPEPG